MVHLVRHLGFVSALPKSSGRAKVSDAIVSVATNQNPIGWGTEAAIKQLPQTCAVFGKGLTRETDDPDRLPSAGGFPGQRTDPYNLKFGLFETRATTKGQRQTFYRCANVFR